MSSILEDLKRKVTITRYCRLKAAERLRNTYNLLQNLTTYYSILITILSIWFLRFGNEIELSSILSNMLLIASITLTFFSMFISIKSYQERAFKMENNCLELNKLLNTLDRALAVKNINIEEIKKHQRSYENILIGIENHEPVDYWKSIEGTREKYKENIKRYELKSRIYRIIGIIFPMLLPCILWGLEKIYKYFGGIILS